MKYLLLIHLIFVGVWLGCILTEVVFERALLGQGHAQELILVNLHKRVDMLVEVPAFSIVLITGALMLAHSKPEAWLYVKVSLGLLAMLANAFCVWVVFRRANAAMSDDWVMFQSFDKIQHTWGAVVLLTMLGALGLGLGLGSS